jgi:hypothetical protein
MAEYDPSNPSERPPLGEPEIIFQDANHIIRRIEVEGGYTFAIEVAVEDKRGGGGCFIAMSIAPTVV